MKFDARQVVLLVVNEVGDRANGKTFIQKLCFFVSKLTGNPLGFRPHYYGPYSEEVAGELSFLVGGGFLAESRKGSGVAGDGGWEIARYDYQMTEKGREALKFLDEKYRNECEQVRSALMRVLAAGAVDYVDLSLAAKTVWIRDSDGPSLNTDGIAGAALRFGWQVTGAQVDRATEFLRKLDLAEVG